MNHQSFTAPWSPSDFNDGKTHVIKVVLNQTIVIAESKFSLSPSMSSDLGKVIHPKYYKEINAFNFGHHLLHGNSNFKTQFLQFC